MRRSCACRPVLLLLAVLVPAAGSADPLRVEHGDKPLAGIVDCRLEEIWRQPAESPDYLLGRAIDCVLDEQNNLYVLDYDLKNVLVFGPDGAWLRTIGGEGEGPGEVSDARRLLRRDENYGLLQALPGAIVWLAPDGTSRGKVRIGDPEAGNEVLLNAAFAANHEDEILVWIGQPHYGPDGLEIEEYIAPLLPDGQLGDRLYDAPEPERAISHNRLDESRRYNVWERRFACDGQGGAWIAPRRDEWLLERRNETGKLVLEVSRDDAQRERTAAETDRLLAWYEKSGWAADQVQIARHAPMIRSLRCADDGTLWVERDPGGRRDGSDLETLIDIVGLDGRWLRRLRLHTDLEVHTRLLPDDGHVLLVVIDAEFDEMSLRFCRIVAQQ